MRFRFRGMAGVILSVLLICLLTSGAQAAMTQTGTAGIGASSPEGLECFTFTSPAGGQANFRVWWTGFSDYLELFVTCDLYEEDALGWARPYDDRVLTMSLGLPVATTCWACVGMDLGASATDTENFKINLVFAVPPASEALDPDLEAAGGSSELPVSVTRILERRANASKGIER